MIEQPPHTPTAAIDISNESEELKNLISSINSKYLYWSDVKYRMPSGMTDIELWSKVKSVRNLTDVKVWTQNNIHFSLTNTMQRLCHEFDMNFGGSWGASKIFPEDKTTQELYLISSIMEEAIASSQMEGAATTREAAKEMLRKKISPKDKSQRMILNNYNTINFIRDHAKESLTPAFIKLLHLGNITIRQAEILSLCIENPDIVLVSTDIVGKFRVTPNTAKSDLRKLTEKGYLLEISLNGRTKGYIRSSSFEQMVNKIK